MKRLILMRHAKSSWSGEVPTDHERPLNDRGRRQAPEVGQQLAAEGWCPELVLSSDAVRTRQTWERLQPYLGDSISCRFERSLYLGGLFEIAQLAEGLDEATTVLALGHNPGWEEAASALVHRDLELRTAHAALLEALESKAWPELLEPSTAPRWRWVRTVVPDA